MRGLVHFALLELRRRATAFLPFAILLAGAIFSGCLLCFTIVAISAADADWNMLIWVGAVGLALLVVCGLLLQSGRLNQNEREYDMLWYSGVTNGRFVIIQLVQYHVVFFFAAIVGLAAAIVAFSWLISRVNSDMSEYLWLDELPIQIGGCDLTFYTADFTSVVVILPAVYLAFLVTTLLSSLLWLGGGSLSNLKRLRGINGRACRDRMLFCGEKLSLYVRLSSVRLNRDMTRLRIFMTLCLILPFVFCAANFTYRKNDFPWHIGVMTDTMHRPVTETLADQFSALDGIVEENRNDGTDIYEKITFTTADEKKYSSIQYKIETEKLREILTEMSYLIAGTGHELSSSYLSFEFSSIRGQLPDGVLFTIGIALGVTGLSAIIAVMREYYVLRRAEYRVLYSLGVDPKRIYRMKLFGGTRFALPCSILGAALGMAAYCVLALLGGDTPKLTWVYGFIGVMIISVLITMSVAAAITRAERSRKKR